MDRVTHISLALFAAGADFWDAQEMAEMREWRNARRRELYAAKKAGELK